MRNDLSLSIPLLYHIPTTTARFRSGALYFAVGGSNCINFFRILSKSASRRPGSTVSRTLHPLSFAVQELGSIYLIEDPGKRCLLHTPIFPPNRPPYFALFLPSQEQFSRRPARSCDSQSFGRSDRFRRTLGCPLGPLVLEPARGATS